MAVSRMLKVQLIVHAAVKDEVTAFLREAGVVEVTDVELEGFRGGIDEEEAGRLARLADKADSAIRFLDPYVRKLSFAERLRSGPLRVSPADIEKASAAIDVEKVALRCAELESSMRKCRDELAWSVDLVRELEPWRSDREPARVPLHGAIRASVLDVSRKGLRSPRSRRRTRRIRSSSMTSRPRRREGCTRRHRAARRGRSRGGASQTGRSGAARLRGAHRHAGGYHREAKSRLGRARGEDRPDRGGSARALARASRASRSVRSLPRTARASRYRAAFPPHGAHVRARGVDAGDPTNAGSRRSSRNAGARSIFSRGRRGRERIRRASSRTGGPLIRSNSS